MTAKERAAHAMMWHFGKAKFDPTAYKLIEEVMALTVQAAEHAAREEEREVCAVFVENRLGICAEAARKSLADAIRRRTI